MPVLASERAVIDAAAYLFSGKRLALVVDGSMVNGDPPPGVAIVPAAAFAAGAFDLGWLDAPLLPMPSAPPDEETARFTGPGARSEVDIAVASRRVKRAADAARVSLATDGLAIPPRLDLIAVIEDEIAWARASGTGFGIVLAHSQGVATQRTKDGAAAADARVREAVALLASAARSSDTVAGSGDEFVIVLPEAGLDGAREVARRVARAALRAQLHGAKRQRAGKGGGWRIASASFPQDGATRDALLAKATASLTEIER